MSDHVSPLHPPARGLHMVPDLPTRGVGDAPNDSFLRTESSREERCLAMREVWSSSLDGEALDTALDTLNKVFQNETSLIPATLTLDDVNAHMLRCSNCAVVAQSADSFRRLRVRSIEADTLPDLRPALRAAITREVANTLWRKEKFAANFSMLKGPISAPLHAPPERPFRPVSRTGDSVKVPGRRLAMAPSILIALAITGLAQAIGALPDLLGSANGGALSGAITGVEHLTREAAASEIALAAGFLSVAVKPFMAAAVRLFATVLTALVIFSTLTSGAQGTGGLPIEAHHLIALFGTTLLWLLPSNFVARSSAAGWTTPTSPLFSGPSFH